MARKKPLTPGKRREKVGKLFDKIEQLREEISTLVGRNVYVQELNDQGLNDNKERLMKEAYDRR